MKANPNKSKRVNVQTLGCSKNIWDSEMLMGQLRANKMDVVHEQQTLRSDTVVINTCGFIENAKQESIDTILEFAEAKKEGRINHLIVMGCLSERYRDDLQLEIPEVDSWFGTRQLPDVLKALEADYKYELLGERLLTTPSHYAFFKIAEGCNRPCSFCAIPIMRGGHQSFPVEQLVAQAKSLASQGTKELILIAQDLTYYGLDIYGKRTLADLLLRLSDVEGIEWIRLQYAYPSQFPEDILPVMRERANICNYLDMPLQHASSNVLKIMRRGITRRRTEELLDKIRNEVPGIALRTTMLVGHPGETEADVQELLQFVQDQKFDRLGVFPYSHEDHTHAFSLADEISETEKESRAERVMEVQREVSFAKNQQRIGQELKVMIDRVEGEYFVGRTEYDSPEVDNEVLVKADGQYLRIGDFARIKITDALEYDLFGEIIPD
ncbi:MAG: 30S ribosomal protein S12 methylthiotransferase RimO [Bacteroidia bacterium]